ncbi:T9SS type A sorting domain-containing protein [Bacteroidota bacterium]
MQKIFKNIFKSIIICILAVINLHAQSGQIVFDSKGTDFWLAFLPNYHNYISSSYPSLSRGDSLYIFIVAEAPTSGSIEYKDRNGNDYIENFTINDTKDIFTFKVSHYNFEVKGYNNVNKILDDNEYPNQSEKAGNNSFHISSDNEVTVYAHSQSVMTSDAFLVLPTDVLGTEHLILSYYSDGAGSSGWPTGWFESTSSTPSQFLIVASADNTNITINPSADVHVRGAGSFDIVLNEGEVFLVQAKVTRNNLRPDLTGTEIISGKPIAVFSGQQRALLPVDDLTLISRDCLIEQMLPVKTWGKNAFVIPYIHPADASISGRDLFRVLIGSDDTDVYINGNFEGQYDKGEFIERGIFGPLSVEASGPILVAQYKKTSGGGGSSSQDRPISDPFMMLVPPKEQFMSDYSVINTQAYENEANNFGGNDIPTGNVFKVYTKHYIAIVAPESAIDNTEIDGNLINRNLFKVIPNSTYYYTNVEVSEGAHRVNSTGRIGIYVYGYGGANSYGYVGGLSMMEFDFKKPRLLSVDSCYSLRGMVYETNIGDTKIKSVNAPEELRENVDVMIEPFNPYRDSVYFKAYLQDRLLDGSFEIFAEDSIGLDSTKIYEIPGFTVSVDPIGSKDEVILFDKQFRTAMGFCEYFELNNYGKFSHDIIELYLKNNSDIDINLSATFTIHSSEILPLELCFRFDGDTIITDTLIISEDCGSRSLIAIRLVFQTDNNEPDITIISDSCKNRFNIIIDEPSVFDWGIKAVKIDEVMNCKVSQLSRNTKQEVYVIDIVDPYKDAIYIITAEDSAGNTRTITDTIQGFTIEMPQFENTKNRIDYDYEKIGYIACDKLELVNSGILPYKIDDIFLKHNVTFSIPQIQFPLIINPSGQENVEICFHPYDTYDIFRDTLILVHNCLTMDVELQGIGDTLIYYGESDCKVRIKTIAHSINPEYYLEQNSPNPVLTTTGFSFGLPDEGRVNLSLFDLLGNNRITVLNDVLEKGSYRIEASLDDLPKGVYFYVLNSKTGRISGTLIKE